MERRRTNRSRVLALALLGFGGCYASHEPEGFREPWCDENLAAAEFAEGTLVGVRSNDPTVLVELAPDGTERTIWRGPIGYVLRLEKVFGPDELGRTKTGMSPDGNSALIRVNITGNELRNLTLVDLRSGSATSLTNAIEVADREPSILFQTDWGVDGRSIILTHFYFDPDEQGASVQVHRDGRIRHLGGRCWEAWPRPGVCRAGSVTRCPNDDSFGKFFFVDLGDNPTRTFRDWEPAIPTAYRAAADTISIGTFVTEDDPPQFVVFREDLDRRDSYVELDRFTEPRSYPRPLITLRDGTFLVVANSADGATMFRVYENFVATATKTFSAEDDCDWPEIDVDRRRIAVVCSGTSEGDSIVVFSFDGDELARFNQANVPALPESIFFVRWSRDPRLLFVTPPSDDATPATGDVTLPPVVIDVESGTGTVPLGWTPSMTSWAFR